MPQTLFLPSRARTLWLTGLSGSGKSTLSAQLSERLKADSIGHFLLDGDVVRTGLCRDLGFSPEDRHENIRRVAELSRLMNQAGLHVLCALISPLREDRAMARRIIGEPAFVEVHVATPLVECERRDPKGLYAKARAGLLPGFTGISAPYEAPEHPDCRLDTSQLSLEEAVGRLAHLLDA